MNEFTNITSKNHKQYHFKNIVFFSFAEGGAMGIPCEIEILALSESNTQWYRTNYYKDINYDELIEIFPPVKTLQIGLFYTKGLPKEWKHLDLGYGNHLLVKEEYYKTFIEEVKKQNYNRISQFYIGWKSIAENILTEKRGALCQEEKEE